MSSIVAIGRRRSLSATVAARNDGQQALDSPTIGNRVCEQCGVLPDGERYSMMTVNY